MGGDGGETKQCTLDVLNTDRGLPMCMLLQHLHTKTIMGGDGGETKQCTLDVLNTDRGLPMCMLLQHLNTKTINNSFNLE